MKFKTTLMIRVPIFVALSACLYSCAPAIETFSDRDTKYSMKNYKTYAWIAPGDSVLNRQRPDKFFDYLIISSADAELAKKGMTLDVNNPDALFMYDTHVAEKIKYTQSPTLSVGVGVAGPGYYVGGSAPVAGGKITASTYEEGTLIINMFDTRSGNEIWHGGAVKTIDAKTDMDRAVQTAVRYIFMKLPLKVKKSK